MRTNERMVREDSSGLDLLQAIVDGKAPVPSMARTIPMPIIAVMPGEVIFTATAGQQQRLQDGEGKILAHATATCMILRR